MSKPIYIHENGETREATEQEAIELSKDQAQAQEEQRIFETEQLQKTNARTLALAKLAKLGLTEDEIAAL
jgi:endonuclease/exonuclease/phosphatase (EEP) superfamily protein YafD